MRKPEGAGGRGWCPHSPQAVQKGGLLTRLTLARQDSPFRGQGRKGDAPFATFHVSRICRTKLADFFNSLLGAEAETKQQGYTLGVFL